MLINSHNYEIWKKRIKFEIRVVEQQLLCKRTTPQSRVCSNGDHCRGSFHGAVIAVITAQKDEMRRTHALDIHNILPVAVTSVHHIMPRTKIICGRITRCQMTWWLMRTQIQSMVRVEENCGSPNSRSFTVDARRTHIKSRNRSQDAARLIQRSEHCCSELMRQPRLRFQMNFLLGLLRYFVVDRVIWRLLTAQRSASNTWRLIYVNYEPSVSQSINQLFRPEPIHSKWLLSLSKMFETACLFHVSRYIHIHRKR